MLRPVQRVFTQQRQRQKGERCPSLETAVPVGTAGTEGQETWTISEGGSGTWVMLTLFGRQSLRRPPGFPGNVHTQYNPLPWHMDRTYEYIGVSPSWLGYFTWQSWRDVTDGTKVPNMLTLVNHRGDYLGGGPDLIRGVLITGFRGQRWK